MEAAPVRPGNPAALGPRARALLSATGLVLDAAVIAPSLGDAARRWVWAQALQFAVLAVAAPGLLVAGAPWEILGLGRPARALADARRRHPERLRSAVIVTVGLACLAWWRTPVAVDHLERNGWLLTLEVLSVTVLGVALWLECIGSPPLVPRSPRPLRIAVAAVSMWTVWVLAYLLGMSRTDWFPAFHHAAGRGLSLWADQQVAAAILWAVGAACFIPVVFWNLIQWLRSEEDPDEELHRLLREERRRAVPPAPPG